MPEYVFRPHPLMRNPHVQTLGVNFYTQASGIQYERVRLTTTDDDFIDLDIPDVGASLPVDAPVLLVVHGLEGDARRGYMCATYREMARVGIRTVGMNLRGCSGESNRHAYSYHLGSTQDISVALAWLRTQYPQVPLALMGFSLGGNITIKFTGEQGRALVGGALIAAIAISPPFDSTRPVKLNAFPSTLYRSYLLKDLRAKARINAAAITLAGGNAAQGMTANTLGAYDDAITAPLNGFVNVDDYYRRASCGQFIPAISIPTLIIRAKDDPFFYDDIPYEAVAANAHITGVFTAHGGHCAFIEGWRRTTHVDWAQQTAANWLKEVFK